jgi:hypothetical protein
MKGTNHMKKISNLTYAALAVVSLAIGAMTAHGAPNNLFVSINGTGDNGGGFIYQYTASGVQSTFASGLSWPCGVRFDHLGNLFVANMTCDVFGNCQGFIAPRSLLHCFLAGEVPRQWKAFRCACR